MCQEAVNADDKNAHNLTELAVCYLYGIGTTKNYYTAFSLLEQACNIDIHTAEAQDLLGDCYRNGWGTSQNIKEAVNHYSIAAQKHNSCAQYSLGMIYFYGENGIPKNEKLAYHLFEHSAKNGNEDAQKWLDEHR